jgi:translocation and assembly module TamB
MVPARRWNLRNALTNTPFQFVLNGTNVPLSRSPESIIRSDLHLVVAKTNGTPPLISGEARLRNSYYLSDLSLLAPGKVTTPQGRPPYFSIDNPWLADWRLAVRVTGAGFLQARSPIFSGVVSANLKLQGSLKDPIALGDVKIDSGIVRFPFANLQVQQGFVSLLSEDPYHPQLSVSAVSKQFGYDIKMQVSGPADAPLLEFASTPPLSSEEILLMVTAGQLPRQQLTLSNQQRAEALGIFLGRDLLAKLGFGDSVEQRLTIHSGEQISLQGAPTYSVEYRLNKRWAIIGEYDQFDDYNVGAKWRIYSK